MKKFTSQEIKEFVSKPLFDEKVILKKDLSTMFLSLYSLSCLRWKQGSGANGGSP